MGPPPPVFDLAASARIADMAAWGAPPSDVVEAEIKWAVAALDVDATFTTLTFHDSCPPNRIVTTTGMRAVDLEMAAQRTTPIAASESVRTQGDVQRRHELPYLV